MSRLVALTVVAIISLPAAAWSARGNIDIIEQNIALQHLSEEIVVSLDARARTPAEADRWAIFTFGLPIEAVTVNGAAAQVIPNPSFPEYLSDLVAPTAVPADVDFTIGMTLRGVFGCRSEWSTGAVSCVDTEEELLLGYPGYTNHWFISDAEDRADPVVGHVQVTTLTAHTVVAGVGAAKAVVDNGDGTSTWHFDFDLAISSMPLFSGAASIVNSTTGFPVRAVYMPGPEGAEENLAELVDVASRVLSFYRDLYGGRVFDEAHFLVAPTNYEFGGLAFVGNVVLGGWMIDDDIEVPGGDRHGWLNIAAAHEFAHTWWGNTVTGVEDGEGLLFSESFGEYSAWRALGQIYGGSTRMEGNRMNALWYMLGLDGEDIALLDRDIYYSPSYVFVGYHKAPVVLRMIEQAAGIEGFTQALRTVVARESNTIDDLIADIYAATGYDATRDVDEWFRHTGFPVLTIASEVALGEQVTVTLSAITDGTFHCRVPVRFVLEGGSTLSETLLTAPGSVTQQFVLPAAPLAIEVDPEWTLVRELHPALLGDVTFDGDIDGADLIEAALHAGGAMPTERRVDGHFDPLFDIDGDRSVGASDLSYIAMAARQAPNVQP